MTLASFTSESLTGLRTSDTSIIHILFGLVQSFLSSNKIYKREGRRHNNIIHLLASSIISINEETAVFLQSVNLHIHRNLTEFQKEWNQSQFAYTTKLQALSYNNLQSSGRVNFIDWYPHV